MDSIKILIVEDEIIIAEDISLRLSEMGYFVVQTIENVELAIECLEKQEVDLAIIDISLTGQKTGIDLAAVINERFHFPFIFLTSHTEESIIEKAKKVNPAAYLLKPFNDHQVKIAIEMALSNFYGDYHTETVPPEERTELLKLPGSLFLKKGSHYEKVEFAQILWLEAESNYTSINTKSGKYTYSTVLKKFEDKLPVDTFFRVHRSFIVNLHNISGFEGNMLIINDTYIPMNRSCREVVLKRFMII